MTTEYKLSTVVKFSHLYNSLDKPIWRVGGITVSTFQMRKLRHKIRSFSTITKPCGWEILVERACYPCLQTPWFWRNLGLLCGHPFWPSPLRYIDNILQTSWATWLERGWYTSASPSLKSPQFLRTWCPFNSIGQSFSASRKYWVNGYFIFPSCSVYVYIWNPSYIDRYSIWFITGL